MLSLQTASEDERRAQYRRWLAAHDARIASEALIRAAKDIEANADPMGQPDPAWLAGMESAARRVRDRAEREGVGEGGAR